MLKWFKRLLAKYDAWCLSMGLTPDKKRSCIPYRSEPTTDTQSRNKAQQ